MCYNCDEMKDDPCPHGDKCVMPGPPPELADLENTLMSERLTKGLEAMMRERPDHLIIREVSTTTRCAPQEDRMLQSEVKKVLRSSTNPKIKKLARRWSKTVRVLAVAQRREGRRAVLVGVMVFQEAEGEEGSSKHVMLDILDTNRYGQPSTLHQRLWLELLVLATWHYRALGFVSMRWHACAPKKGEQYVFFGQPADKRSDKQRRDGLDAFYQKLLQMLPLVSYSCKPGSIDQIPDHLLATAGLEAPTFDNVVHKKFEKEMGEGLKKLRREKGEGGLTVEGVQQLEAEASKAAADAVDYESGDNFFVVDLQRLKEGEESTNAAQALDAAVEVNPNLPTKSSAPNQTLFGDRSNVLAMIQVRKERC